MNLTKIQAIKKKGRKANPLPVKQSRKAEIVYTSELLKLVDIFQDQVKKELLPLARGYRVGDSFSVQVSDRFLQSFLATLANLRLRFSGIVDSVAVEIAKRIVEQNKASTDKQLADMLFKLTGMDFTVLMRSEDLQDAVSDAVSSNAQLIKSIPSQYLNKIEQAVINNIQSGKDSKNIVKAIQEIGFSTEKRARLIARDQTGKLTSKLTETRQVKLGITHYYWSCSHDERVRKLHLDRDGKLYAWSHVHSDGHPGIPINCRCVAIPYTAHLFNPTAPTPEEIIALQEAA